MILGWYLLLGWHLELRWYSDDTRMTLRDDARMTDHTWSLDYTCNCRCGRQRFPGTFAGASLFSKMAIHHRKLCWKNFGFFFAHLRYLPKLPFLCPTQLAIFRIEYNAFSKAKFGNFQRLLILNIYLQTIIMSEKNSIWIESNVI